MIVGIIVHDSYPSPQLGRRRQRCFCGSYTATATRESAQP